MRRPRTPCLEPIERRRKPSGIDVESIGSWPPMTSSTSAASATVVANGPIWSRLRRERHQAVAGDRAVGGLHPDHAAERRGLTDRAAGVGAEPNGAKPAATAAALPPRDRPDAAVSWGLSVGPNAEFSVDEPIANSSRFVLPTAIAPALSSRCTTVASYGGHQPSRIFDEHVVGTPRVHRLSLSATGTPASGPGSSPAATRRSISAAAAAPAPPTPG